MDATKDARAGRGGGGRGHRRRSRSTRRRGRAPISTSGSATSSHAALRMRALARDAAAAAMTGASAAPHRDRPAEPARSSTSGRRSSAYGQALLAAPRADESELSLGGGARGRPGGAGGARPGGGRRARSRRGCAATAAGLEVWQRHPYRRALADPPAVWSGGCSRLLDYGAVPEAVAPDGPPVLVVPSLINRAYILDLAPGRSMLRWLAAQGLRPLLARLGHAGAAEAGFDLDRYGAERLVPALAVARRLPGGRCPSSATAWAGRWRSGSRRGVPDEVAAVATIGAPWDFARSSGSPAAPRDDPVRRRAARRGAARRAGRRLRHGAGVAVPAALRAGQPAAGGAEVPEAGAARSRRGRRRELFVALEDWLADGVPMPLGAAQRPARRLAESATGRRPAAGASSARSSTRGRIRRPALVFCGAPTASRRRRWRRRSGGRCRGGAVLGPAPGTSA